MRAAVYARYSSHQQRAASIDDQLRRCREEIAARGWTEIAGACFTDAEVSGSIEARAGYQAMLAAARRREFDVIVVEELSRLTRDGEEREGLRKRLRFWGVHLRALSDGIDTVLSPEAAGPLMMLQGYRAEQEVEATATRTRRGQRGRILAGYHAGGAPYGYRSRPVHADKPGDPPGTGPVVGFELVVHPEEAKVVRRVFREYAGGKSPRAIAADLNAAGVAPPGAAWRDRQGVRCTWTHSAIQGSRKRGTGVLHQRKYVGELVWNRSTWLRDPERGGRRVRRDQAEQEWVEVQADSIRIVPDKLWERVQERLAVRARDGTGWGACRRERRLLSGMLVCGQCGAKYVMTGRNTYACAGRVNRGETVCDCRATVNAAEAERKVVETIQRVVYGQGMVEEVVERVRRRWVAEQKRKRAASAEESKLRRRLVDLNAEAGRLVEAIAQGVLVEDLRKRMARLETDRAAVAVELKRCGRSETPQILKALPAMVAKVIATLSEAMEQGHTEKVRAILRKMVERIEVQGVEVEGRKRPATRLLLRGDLVQALAVLGTKSTYGSSGGALLTLLTSTGAELPEVVVVLGGGR